METALWIFAAVAITGIAARLAIPYVFVFFLRPETVAKLFAKRD